MLDEELRKTNAQSSTDQPTEVDLERLFVDAYQATGAELLQQRVAWLRALRLLIPPTLSRPSCICAFRVALSQQSFSGFLAHLQTLRNARNSQSEKSCVGLLQAMVDNLTQ